MIYYIMKILRSFSDQVIGIRSIVDHKTEIGHSFMIIFFRKQKNFFLWLVRPKNLPCNQIWWRVRESKKKSYSLVWYLPHRIIIFDDLPHQSLLSGIWKSKTCQSMWFTCQHVETRWNTRVFRIEYANYITTLIRIYVVYSMYVLSILTMYEVTVIEKKIHLHYLQKVIL